MVFVPAGEFILGSNANDRIAENNEKPAYQVFLSSFWIDQHEVTNGEFKRFVDAGGYRERRRAMLEEEAAIAAERAKRNGEPVRLEPMSASERRMVHEVLKDRSDVETYSEGDEPDRRIVVAPLIGD